MTFKTKLALATVLFSTLASPVFAASQDEASVTGNSGRIVAVAPQINVPHAYASAARGWTRVMATQDVQLQGRGL